MEPRSWFSGLVKIHAQGVPPRDDVEHVDVAKEARLRLRPAAAAACTCHIGLGHASLHSN